VRPRVEGPGGARRAAGRLCYVKKEAAAAAARLWRGGLAGVWNVDAEDRGVDEGLLRRKARPPAAGELPSGCALSRKKRRRRRRRGCGEAGWGLECAVEKVPAFLAPHCLADGPQRMDFFLASHWRLPRSVPPPS
jgi:hypothetical protein